MVEMYGKIKLMGHSEIVGRISQQKFLEKKDVLSDQFIESLFLPQAEDDLPF